MHRRKAFAVLALAAMALVGYGCAETSSEEAETQLAARVEEVKGTNLKRVILTAHAVKRLGLRMTPITGQAGAEVVPYAAVVYDGKGDTWVYVSPEPRKFERKPITISDITGDDVLLSAGPDAGTPVVTVGAAELFGAEDEIGAEEPE